MTRDDDTVRDSVKAVVPFMMRRKTKKDTQGRVRCEFVASCGGEVGIADAPKKRADDRTKAECHREQSVVLTKCSVFVGRMLSKYVAVVSTSAQ